MNLRPIRAGDIAECADLHLEAFPGFFLSQLGSRFLREFYRSFVNADSAVSAIAIDEDGLTLGVVVGTTAPAGFFRRMLRRRWWAFAFASLGLLTRNPRHLPRLARAVAYRGRYPVKMSGALLSSICVRPGAPAGTGQALLGAFVRAVAERGIYAAHLTTDADDNERANRFYREAGWRRVGTFETPQGRRMNAYQWNEHNRSAEGRAN